MAIQTYAQYKNARKVEIPFYSPSFTSVAGYYYSYWRDLVHTYNRIGAVPAGLDNPTNTTNGAIPIPSVSGTEKIYLDYIEMSSSATGGILLEDIIAIYGGLSGTSVTEQSCPTTLINPSADNRCASDGSDAFWYLEWYSATGSTVVNASVGYTNDLDTSNVAVIGIAASTPAKRRLIIYPTINDAYIKRVNSVTLSATTGTAGNFGVTAVKRIAMIPVLVANTINYIDFTGNGFIEINPKACLSMSRMCLGTASGVLMGKIGYVIG